MVSSDGRTHKIFWILFILLSSVNAAVIAAPSLQLSADETHYWDWSRRLDWSYYSKGPLVAWLIAGGRFLFGDTEFGVRFPAFFCYSFFSAVIYFFLRRFYSAPLALLGFGIVRSMLIFVQMGILMTTDAPAALFWLLALICAYFAVLEERRSAWILFGLFIGLGVGAKYTVIFLFGSVALFLAITPQVRNHLRSWQFWAGTLAMAISLSPILIWNSQHGWVNFAHNAGHVVRSSGGSLSPRYLPELVGGQIGLVGPVLFFILCLAMQKSIKLWRAGDLGAGLLLFSCLPLGVFVLVISLGKRVYANWPMPIWIGTVLLLVHLLSLRKFGNGQMTRWIRAGIFISALMSLGAHIPLLGYTLGVPGQYLPTKKLTGWRELGEKLSDETAKFLPPGEIPIVIADEYETASAAAFYTNPHAESFCAYVDGRRMNQYDVWGGWEGIKGRDVFVVSRTLEKAEAQRAHFQSFEPIGAQPALRIEYAGSLLREYYIFRGKNFDGTAPGMPSGR